MSKGRVSPRSSVAGSDGGLLEMKRAPATDNDEKFDTYKWRDVIIANIDMVDNKVKQQTAHQILERELDDLKVIVCSSFEQMSRSVGRQVGNARKEADTVAMYAE